MSLAAVYKTFRVLKDLRLVQELPSLGGEARFDTRVEPHANLICQRCGNINDVDDP
jgi:Fur family peroxide stress response transcriptional regulator